MSNSGSRRARRGRSILAITLAAQSCTAGSARANTESAALRAHGLQLVYSLDYEDAVVAYKRAIAADPNDSAAYRGLAALTWMHLMFQRGAVMVDDYLGETRPNLVRPPPPSDVDALFQEYARRALTLAENELHNNPTAADAHYQLGATLAFLASYAATAEGVVLRAFRTARRAYGEHERVLELDPRRKDAGLVVGTYRYGVSTLSIPLRVLAHVAGFGGDQQRGLQLIEAASLYPSEAQSDARFALIVIYNREGRYDDALRQIRELQRQYPRNRLLWLEAGSTALRGGRAAEARDALVQGLDKLMADRRPRAFGEEARWRYYHGAALLVLNAPDAAERELRTALTLEAPDWVHGRSPSDRFSGRVLAPAGPGRTIRRDLPPMSAHAGRLHRAPVRSRLPSASRRRVASRAD